MNLRVFVLALSTFAFGSGAFIFAGLLEPMAADLGVSVGAVGQLQTVYVLTSALAGPPLAFLVGRFERKRVLLLALSAAVLLNLACLLTAEFGALLVLRAILGAIGAMAGPAASASASALVPPERRGSALAIVMGGMTVAFLMGIPLGSVVGSAFGWRSTFLLSAGLSALALAAIAVWALVRLGRQTERRGRAHWRVTATLLGAVLLAGGAQIPIGRCSSSWVTPWPFQYMQPSAACASA